MKFTKFDAGGWPGVQLDLDPASAGHAEAPSLSPGTPESPGAVTAPSAEQPEETGAKEIAEEIYKVEEATSQGLEEVDDLLGEKKRRLAEVEKEIAGIQKDTEFLIKRSYSYYDKECNVTGVICHVLMPDLKGLPGSSKFCILKQLMGFPENAEFISRSADLHWKMLEEKYRGIKEAAERTREERKQK